jgi:hypothetical protein
VLQSLPAAVAVSLFAGSSLLTHPQQAHANEIATGKDDGAKRSTLVRMYNDTGCVLDIHANKLDHGKWTPDSDPSVKRTQIVKHEGVDYEAIPAGSKSVQKNSSTSWESQSAGSMTGTEGTVEWRTRDCDDETLSSKSVKVHWSNPFFGANSYTFVTDPGLKGYLQNFAYNGKGNNAGAAVTITRS